MTVPYSGHPTSPIPRLSSSEVCAPDIELLAAVENFVVNRVGPNAEHIDRHAVFLPELIHEAADLGLQRLLFDKDLNLDLSKMPLVHHITERISSHSPAVALQISGTRLVAYLLARYANTALKAQWLEATVNGHAYGSFAITEPHAGTDIRGINTVAVRKGGSYILSGEKCWVGFAPLAAYAIVLAKVDSSERDAKTVALVVDMSSAGASGQDGEELSGFRGMPNGILRFDKVDVPVENALNVEGFAGMMDGLNMARIEAASYACGLLRGALEQSVERAVARTAFGKLLGDLPSIQMKLGRMLAAYHAARELTLRASESYMNGRGGDQDIISVAKMTASDLAREHTDQAMQIFGASGIAVHSSVERMHRDAKVTQIFDGTSEIHETMLGRRLVRAFGTEGLRAPYLPVQSLVG